MLCSIPPSKSGSSWLDRLRTSKGFPVQTGLDLEHFLNPTNSTIALPSQTDFNSNSPPGESPPIDGKLTVGKPKISSKPISSNEEKKGDWFNIMNSVLSDLFNMGDSHEMGRRSREFGEKKKSFRKQAKPKICILSASASVEESCLAGALRTDGAPALSPPSSADNSVAEAKNSDGRTKERKQGDAASPNLEEENSPTVAVDLDLSTFSRAEVTIIDTSSAPNWKSEKLIFRKGDVWKIRDKKQSSGNASRRKRKLDRVDDREAGVEEKQHKTSGLHLNSSKETSQEEHLFSSDGGSTYDDKRATSKETPDKVNPILERRAQFSRSPRKPATKDTTVFLIQCIPTSRKNDAYCSKNRLKDKQ